MSHSPAARAPHRLRCVSERLEPRHLLSAYSIVDLGTLGGGLSWAYDLNNSNQVVGYSATAAGNDHAFIFSDANGNGVADAGEMIDLGALPGDAASYAYGINEAGKVVGTSRSVPLGADGDERAVAFNPGGQPTDLGLGAGSNGYSSNAIDVNDSAQIVGGTLSGTNYVPFVRSAGGAVSTFTLPAPYNLWGEARAINDAGAVVGYSGSPAGDSGFLRSPGGTLTRVGHANAALPYSYAWDVNDAGQVVGEGYNSAGDYRAFLWQNGSAADLGTLPGMGSSEAYGVNNAGAAVGRAEPPDGTPGSTKGFLYRDGVLRDLNDLIPSGSGWFIADARAINDHGAIAAVGFNPSGAIHAGLLLPTPVQGRHVFYNNSAFDGHDPAATAADDGAIAPDKTPRIGSTPTTFANVTSYSRGINGVMIDIPSAGGPLSASDFRFGVGPDLGGPLNPAPTPRSITIRRGAGAGGSDRVTFVWEDGAIQTEWLQITVLPSGATGLWEPDVFSFGNLVGDFDGVIQTGSGGATFGVDANDVARTRQRMGETDATATAACDFNRDGVVDVRDYAAVRRHAGQTLQAIPATPTASSPLQNQPVPLDPIRSLLRPLRRHSFEELPIGVLV